MTVINQEQRCGSNKQVEEWEKKKTGYWSMAAGRFSPGCPVAGQPARNQSSPLWRLWEEAEEEEEEMKQRRKSMKVLWHMACYHGDESRVDPQNINLLCFFLSALWRMNSSLRLCLAAAANVYRHRPLAHFDRRRQIINQNTKTHPYLPRGLQSDWKCHKVTERAARAGKSFSQAVSIPWWSRHTANWPFNSESQEIKAILRNGGAKGITATQLGWIQAAFNI